MPWWRIIFLRCLDCLVLLNCSGVTWLSTTETASKKIGLLICSIKFPSSETAFHTYEPDTWTRVEYWCHVGVGAFKYHLDLLDTLQERVCRTIGPILVTFVEPLAHRHNVASVSLFCRHLCEMNPNFKRNIHECIDTLLALDL